jgi:hypothetical protein
MTYSQSGHTTDSITGDTVFVAFDGDKVGFCYGAAKDENPEVEFSHSKSNYLAEHDMSCDPKMFNFIISVQLLREHMKQQAQGGANG